MLYGLNLFKKKQRPVYLHKKMLANRPWPKNYNGFFVRKVAKKYQNCVILNIFYLLFEHHNKLIEELGFEVLFYMTRL